MSKLRKADVDVFIIEQKVGDLVILPPMAPHQVINKVRYCVDTNQTQAQNPVLIATSVSFELGRIDTKDCLEQSNPGDIASWDS